MTVFKRFSPASSTKNNARRNKLSKMIIFKYEQHIFSRMIIEWLGQSSFRIFSEDKTIYIDPAVGNYENAEKADIILVTHDHPDHFSKEKIKQISTDDTKLVCPLKVGAEIEGEIMKNGDEKEIGGIKIKAVASYNENKNAHNEGDGNGYIIELEGKKIYHAGDTDLVPEMNLLETDIALLPVGGTYTMDAEEAVAAAMILQPKLAIPMHWGHKTGHEEDATAFKEGIEMESDMEVKILQPGEKIEV
jgi:L-ascorbate metabolism protein UlaG (beta-lactamase superfamily)